MKVKDLLKKLVLLDASTPDFIETSKKLVEAVKKETLERETKKATQPPKEKKAPKELPKPKTELCDNCVSLLDAKLFEIMPKNGFFIRTVSDQ